MDLLCFGVDPIVKMSLLRYVVLWAIKNTNAIILLKCLVPYFRNENLAFPL
jgi:hypothetical protein